MDWERRSGDGAHGSTVEPAIDPRIIVDPAADQRFRAIAARLGMNPDGRFVGGYVDWEWSHSRHLFDGLVAPAAGREVLELGCNVGATAIVLAALGARVTAVDPDADLVELARANAERVGLAERVAFLHVPDTRRLPVADGAFDWVSCNSVLEYVAGDLLGGLLAEIDRVLRPGGVLSVLGTSNGLWPREMHTRRWLINYLPRRLDPLIAARSNGAPLIRGVTARALRRAFPGYEDLTTKDGGELYLEFKARMGAGGAKLRAAAIAGRLLATLGLSVGDFTETITVVLRKP